MNNLQKISIIFVTLFCLNTPKTNAFFGGGVGGGAITGAAIG